jgi:hypothetical protein
MSIGLGIFLIVVGAILAFALNVTVTWINLQLVGGLLIAAGVVITIIGVVLLARRRRTVVTEHATVDPATGARIAERSTSVSGDDVVR